MTRTVLRNRLFPSIQDDTPLQDLLNQGLRYIWGLGMRSDDLFTWKKNANDIVYYQGHKIKSLIQRLQPTKTAPSKQAVPWPRGAELRARRTDLNISVSCLIMKVGATPERVSRVEAHDLLIPPAWIPGLVDVGILAAAVPADQIPSAYTGKHLRSVRRSKNLDVSALASGLGVKPIVVNYVENFDLPVPLEWSRWLDSANAGSVIPPPQVVGLPLAEPPAVLVSTPPKPTPHKSYTPAASSPITPQDRRDAQQILIQRLKKIMIETPRYNVYDLMESMGYADSPGDQRRFRLAIWTARQEVKPKGRFVEGPRRGERAGQYTVLEGEQGVAIALQQVRRGMAKQQRALARLQDDISHIPKMFKSPHVQEIVKKQQDKISSLLPPKPTK